MSHFKPIDITKIVISLKPNASLSLKNIGIFRQSPYSKPYIINIPLLTSLLNQNYISLFCHLEETTMKTKTIDIFKTRFQKDHTSMSQNNVNNPNIIRKKVVLTLRHKMRYSRIDMVLSGFILLNLLDLFEFLERGLKGKAVDNSK